MDGSPGDLQAKYHKIAGEYSKLRAQIAVLKKAVVEEQAVNGELRDTLREAEQKLRKADQEADSLNFRNEQLTRRVSVLQYELDIVQNQCKNKKSKLKSQDGQHQTTDLPNHVIDEEFRKKIQENAKLLSLINEKEDQHRQELSNVTSQLDQVSFELSQLQRSARDAEEKSRSAIGKLERELSCMREGQQQLTDVSRELAQLRQAHAEYKIQAEAKVAALKAVISSHLPFIDSKKEFLNTLNVPRVMDTKDSLSSGVGEDLRASLQQMAASLALWHKVTESRLHVLPTASSAVNVKFISHLKETGDLALDLERSISPSKICKTMIQRLPGQFASYCSNVETMLVHQRLSLEEEEVDPTDECLRESNHVYLGNCSQLVSHLVQINSRITLYRSMQHSSEAQQKHQRGLISMSNLLQDTFKDLFNAYVLKSGMETERSWSTEELNAANQSVTNSLSSLMESSAKIAKCLREMWKAADTTPAPHPLVPDLRRRGVHYINAIHTDEAPTISYSQALRDHEEAQNSSQLRLALLHQLEENKDRLVRAEQERDQWKQELQLLQLRYQKEKEEPIKNDEFTSLVSSTVTNMIGSLDVPVNLPQEVEAREEAVKQYFRQRINKLIAKNGELQSRSAVLLAETAALVRRLEASVSTGSKLEEALHEAKERVTQLQEEVTTTASNYEAQLSTMSEHLANMNEKLAQQRETIDQLEYQISNKKKGKK